MYGRAGVRMCARAFSDRRDRSLERARQRAHTDDAVYTSVQDAWDCMRKVAHILAALRCANAVGEQAAIAVAGERLGPRALESTAPLVELGRGCLTATTPDARTPH